MEKMRYFIDIPYEKVIIFEYEKYQAGAEYTDDEIQFSPLGIGFPFYVNTSKVINNNCYKKNGNVVGNECHVKEATCSKQQ